MFWWTMFKVNIFQNYRDILGVTNQGKVEEMESKIAPKIKIYFFWHKSFTIDLGSLRWE